MSDPGSILYNVNIMQAYAELRMVKNFGNVSYSVEEMVLRK